MFLGDFKIDKNLRNRLIKFCTSQKMKPKTIIAHIYILDLLNQKF